MIYWDNNATTPVLPEVREAVLPFLGDSFANPSSPYGAAREASAMMSRSREALGALIDADPDQLVFTSGGTESIAMAWQIAVQNLPHRTHFITTSTEHAAVLETAELFCRRGLSVDVLPVDRSGCIDLEALRGLCSENTALISMMAANNETGILNPVTEIAEIAHECGALYHCDGVQIAGKHSFSVGEASVDLFSVSGHKFHAPKGIGALYLRPDLKAGDWLPGGDQEFGRRAGTENVPGIAGMGKAAELAENFLKIGWGEQTSILDGVVSSLKTSLGGVHEVGEAVERLPNTRLLLFNGVESEALLALLDMEGVCASSGSACASGSQEPSHVLRAMGYEEDRVRSALRLSTSRLSTQKEGERVLELLNKLIPRLRSFNPA